MHCVCCERLTYVRVKFVVKSNEIRTFYHSTEYCETLSRSASDSLFYTFCRIISSIHNAIQYKYCEKSQEIQRLNTKRAYKWQHPHGNCCQTSKFNKLLILENKDLPSFNSIQIKQKPLVYELSWPVT